MAASKADIWMPLYIGDYLADTAHLDAEASGCYLHWLMHYWRKGALLDDLNLLIAVGKLRSVNAPSIAQALLAEFFSKERDGRWHQKRIDEELNAWQLKRLKSQEKASKAAEIRWSKHAPSIPLSNAPSNAQAMLETCPLPLPSPLPLPIPSESPKDSCAEPSPALEEVGVFTLPLVDKSEYQVPQFLYDEYVRAYPAVEVMAEFAKMRVWLFSRPKEMKTRSGIARFMNSWLSKAQNDGGKNGNNRNRKPELVNHEELIRDSTW